MTSSPTIAAPGALPLACVVHVLAIAVGAAIAGHELRQLFRRAA